ncbi:alpha/beta fold hydrolase [Paraconexibacter algicola]|uniref:Alpha/beta hydrolase n=1 Tax=Paraconexibacter algicola TaxID=2133960 RepID=A0A2T4UFF9_9ACTN|nr:alpha/beta fold hydrolase [Paraconexibacter algicola]PTL56517.1 alpha/beta hydrolase [Paraconexibacter algicola]
MSHPSTLKLPSGPLVVHDDGPVDGPAVVFVHGFLVDSRLWEATAEALADDHRVVRPDLPLGAHRTPIGTYAALSPRGVARLVLELLDALDLEDVTLVGNDTGGAICQFVLDERPSRVGRLVLTNCDGFETFPPAPFNLVHLLKRVPGGVEVALAPMRLRLGRHIALGTLARTRIPDELLRAWSEPFLTDRAIRRETMTFLRAAWPRDLVEASTRLHRFDGPVLLAWAPADRFFTIGLARRLRDACRDARLVEIPDAKTFVAWDQPQRLADEIRAFAAAQVAAAGAGSHSAG